MKLWIALSGALLACVAACSTPPETASAPVAQCTLARAPAAGASEQEIEIGGVMRRYVLYIPASYTGVAPVPLVFDLHGSGSSPEAQARLSGVREQAEARGFIVVAPAAAMTRPNMNGMTWNVPQQAGAGDDVALIGALIEQTSTSLCIDQTRIYAMGYSGGARLASELACRMPDRFAAISTIAGLRHPSGAEGACLASGGAVPIISFHGTADGVNPYAAAAGPTSATWTYGVDQALTRWAIAMRCGSPAEEEIAPGLTRQRYSGCIEGAEIVHYRMAEKGHIWPGTQARLPPALGPMEDRINATALSLDFFEAHRLH